MPAMRAVMAHFLSVPIAIGIGPMKITAPPPDFISPVPWMALMMMKTMPRKMRSIPMSARGFSMCFCLFLVFLYISVIFSPYLSPSHPGYF